MGRAVDHGENLPLSPLLLWRRGVSTAGIGRQDELDDLGMVDGVGDDRRGSRLVLPHGGQGGKAWNPVRAR